MQNNATADTQSIKYPIPDTQAYLDVEFRDNTAWIKFTDVCLLYDVSDHDVINWIEKNNTTNTYFAYIDHTIKDDVVDFAFVLSCKNVNDAGHQKAIAFEEWVSSNLQLMNDTVNNYDNQTISKYNAEQIFNEYIANNNTSSMISITGEYGSGKSTVKQQLINNINGSEQQFIVINYNSLQYETPSQVTSQLYMEIGNKLNHKENKKLFRACALLKQDSINTPFVGGKFGVMGILGIIVSFIILLLLHLLPIDEIALLIKIVIIITITILSYIFIRIIIINRDTVTRWIASFWPRYTHIQCLKDVNSDEFKDKPLIICVDEMDRLDAQSIKLLLDEILTIHTIFKNQITHKFLLFYNFDELCKLLSHLPQSVSNPPFYLQKYIDNRYVIAKPDLAHYLNWRLYNVSPTIDNVFSEKKANHSYYYKNLFIGANLDAQRIVPNYLITQVLDKYLLSFRDIEKFILHLSTYKYAIEEAMMRDKWTNIIPSKPYNIYQSTDELIRTLFIDFKQWIDIDNNSRKKFNQEFNTQFNKIYNDDATVDNTEDSISDLYNIHKKTRIYPNKRGDDNHVKLLMDKNNDLETIFMQGFESHIARHNIVNYIVDNLSEFAYSRQVNFTDNIYGSDGKLKDNLIINLDNIDKFLLLASMLEDQIAIKLITYHLNYKTCNYTLTYASTLYQGAINAMHYCIVKFMPRIHNIENDAERSLLDKMKIITKEKKYNLQLLHIAALMSNGYQNEYNIHKIQAMLQESCGDYAEFISHNQIKYINLIFYFHFKQILSDKVSSGAHLLYPALYHTMNINQTPYVVGATLSKYIYKYQIQSTDDGLKAKISFIEENKDNSFIKAVNETINEINTECFKPNITQSEINNEQ